MNIFLHHYLYEFDEELEVGYVLVKWLLDVGHLVQNQKHQDSNRFYEFSLKSSLKYIKYILTLLTSTIDFKKLFI
mgnify:CR=1 FL=1